MKRIQILFSEEAWNAIEATASVACKDFKAGSISYSDIVNEMVINARIDIKALQAKHTDLRRSLKVLAAQKDLSLDQVLEALGQIKGKTSKKKTIQLEMEMKNV